MLSETGVQFKDTLMWFAKNILKTFVKPSIYTTFVSWWFVLIFHSRISSCEIPMDQTFRIEDSLENKSCKIEHVHLSISTTSEINCLFRCSDQLISDGVFYNTDNGMCTCCSEIYTVPDELPTDKGTRYYINTYTEGRRDCNDLGDRGYTLSGVYEIFPNGRDGVTVFCEFDDTDVPWTVIQRRIDDTVVFSRNLISYQEGFGNLSGNFWLGLDAISAITLQSGKTFTLKVIVGTDDGELFAKYTHFQVMNATANYTLTIHEYSGNAGDAMTHHDGSPFSTYDRDMDSWACGNCADTLDSGWWFTRCLSSNLNGLYGSTGPGGEGIYWLWSKKNEKLFTFAEMKLQENK